MEDWPIKWLAFIQNAQLRQESGCRDKDNRPRWNSNLGPLTAQSDALTTRPLRPANLHNCKQALEQPAFENEGTFISYYYYYL